MPKWGIHNIVLAEAMAELYSNGNAASQNVSTEMFNNRQHAMLGAVGPDLFFFAPDYEIVDKLFILYKNFEKVIDLYNDIVQPFRDIRDAVVEPVEDAVETLAPSTVALIRAAVEEIKETADLFKSTIETGIFAGVVSGVNILTDAAGVARASGELFDQFIPPMQHNKSEKEWYWFDMLHYRNTGEFGKNLISIAQNGTERQRAYAFGYMSHITTDLVGHAFVNQIVGGPYRLHSQRHVVVENFMDTRKVFEYDGSSVNVTLKEKLGLPDEYEPLHDEICDLLHQAFIDTYPDPEKRPQLVNRETDASGNFTGQSGFLSKDQIKDTYEIFYKVLEFTKKMRVNRPEEPFSGVADVLSEALEDVFEAPPTPPSMPESGACSIGDIFSFGLTSSSRDCYENFFENVEEWFEYLGELIQWAVETMLDIVDLILAALLALPITVLLALLYGIQLLMYELYQSVRMILALEGFVTPEPVDLESSHGRNLTTTFQCETRMFQYPKFKDKTKSPLTCAPNWYERPTTVADFYPSSTDTTPDDFIHERPFDLKSLYAYAFSKSTNETRGLEKAQKKIGNAIDLTSWVIQAAADEEATDDAKQVAYTNWNLDSDRGYGYKTWMADEDGIPKDVNDNDGEVLGERFVDEEDLG